MSIFKCEVCGCVENTATSNYWSAIMEKHRGVKVQFLCSECDPDIGKWHDRFPKRSADGYMLGNDGYLYSKAAVDAGDLKWREDNQGFIIVGPA